MVLSLLNKSILITKAEVNCMGGGGGGGCSWILLMHKVAASASVSLPDCSPCEFCQLPALRSRVSSAHKP